MRTQGRSGVRIPMSCPSYNMISFRYGPDGSELESGWTDTFRGRYDNEAM